MERQGVIMKESWKGIQTMRQIQTEMHVGKEAQRYIEATETDRLNYHQDRGSGHLTLQLEVCYLFLFSPPLLLRSKMNYMVQLQEAILMLIQTLPVPGTTSSMDSSIGSSSRRVSLRHEGSSFSGTPNSEMSPTNFALDGSREHFLNFIQLIITKNG